MYSFTSRGDGAHAPLFVRVLEEARAAHGLEVAHERGQLLIDEHAALAHLVLAREAEDEPAAVLDVEVAVAQRRHAVGAVASHAVLGADAEVEVVDEAHDDGQNLLLRQPLALDVFVGAATQGRQQLAEAHDLFILA